MVKKELIEQISDEQNIPQQDIRIAVDIMLETMSSALHNGNRIEIRGFGSFSTRTHKARIAKNPKSGKTMSIPKRKTVHFTMGKVLKDALID